MSNYIVLEMTAYGIKTLVKTTQQKIDFYLKTFATEDDSKFCGGAGKQVFHQQLLQEMRYRDQQFDNSPMLRMLPQLWNDFIEDCVMFACLDHFLTDRALPVGVDYALYEQMEEIESVLGAPGIVHTVK
jgi:hypothetical protein